MKILVLGAMGMAGHTIALYFKEQGYDVTAFATKASPYFDTLIGDAFDSSVLRKILLGGDFDIVINCIGLLNQTAVDNPSAAVYLNSYLPHWIADVLKELPTRLFHMSTDCVFAGNGGPYTEQSFADGITFYDRTKALGEVNDGKNLTFRNSIIGPDIKEEGIGLFNWFMRQNGVVKGFTGAIWTGVTTLTLAKAMEQAAKDNWVGLINLVNNTSISKFDLIVLFNKYFRNNSITIIPDDKLKLDKTLHSERISEMSFSIPGYEQMIVEMRDWIFHHRTLYPLYYYN